MGNCLTVRRHHSAKVDDAPSPKSSWPAYSPAAHGSPEPRRFLGSSPLHRLSSLRERREGIASASAATLSPIAATSSLSLLPQDMWMQIADLAGPAGRQTMRAVDKVLKTMVESNILQLTVNGPEGLTGLKRSGSFAALRRLTLDGHFRDDDLKGLPASLEELDLSCCFGITMAAMAHISRLPLVSLDVSGRSIGDIGACLLAGSATLTRLNASGNRIGVKGARALAANERLTSLILHGNSIGDAGARFFSRNKTLRSLDVGYNRIGVDGVSSLASNTTLVSLDISTNVIGPRGAKAFAGNTALSALGVRSTLIGDEGARALVDKPTLALIDVRANMLGDDIKQELISLAAGRGKKIYL